MSQRDSSLPRTVIIVPHSGGWEILRECLRSLEASRGQADFCFWLVDNRSPDDSVSKAKAEFPWIEIKSQSRNLGYAGGCNAGLRLAIKQQDFDYAVLLNNDTRLEADWLKQLLKVIEGYPDCAAVQPRLLSIPWPGKLDYSGAAGGLMDAWGYPFALGRIFDQIEDDLDNWQDVRELAWTSGTAALFRLSALKSVGLLDEDFFMHMEEIDLCWRLRSKGWRLASAPQSRVHHHSGFSLKSGSAMKVMLNHRNALLMVLKNWSTFELCWRMPFRLLLDFAALAQYLVSGRFSSAMALLRALAGFLVRVPATLQKRRDMAAIGTRGDSRVRQSTYPGSLVLARYLKGVRQVSQLKWLPPRMNGESTSE